MNATEHMTLSITRRSRIGFAWTNSPERWYDSRGQGHLRISDPGDAPQETGYVRRVYAEFLVVARNNNANDWRCRWFVLHDGEWVAVALDTTDLWTLFNNDPHGRPMNSIEVQVI